MNRYTLLIVILLFSYCSVNYTSTEKQCQVLQTVYDDYQQALDAAEKAKKQNGYKSKAHNLALRKQHKVVKQSIHKIEEYLNLYGFPTEEDHGPDLVKIPRQILIDKGPGLETLERNLPYFYAAWKNGDLPGEYLVYYLQSMHQHHFGDILRLENPYTEETQLDTLQKILNITEGVLELSN